MFVLAPPQVLTTCGIHFQSSWSRVSSGLAAVEQNEVSCPHKACDPYIMTTMRLRHKNDEPIVDVNNPTRAPEISSQA